MKPIRHMLYPLLALTLLMFSSLSQAQYLVEVVVFSQPGAPLAAGAAPERDWDQRGISLEDTARSDVHSIDQSRYTLDAKAQQLTAKGYQIRLHRAWTQPAAADITVAVHSESSLTDSWNGALYPVQGLVTLTDEPLTAAVSFWLNHVSAEGAEPVSERLHMTRRLRVNEIHYLDHKSMGMLIRISRP